jgi:hypothetical protein
MKRVIKACDMSSISQFTLYRAKEYDLEKRLKIL